MKETHKVIIFAGIGAGGVGGLAWAASTWGLATVVSRLVLLGPVAALGFLFLWIGYLVVAQPGKQTEMEAVEPALEGELDVQALRENPHRLEQIGQDIERVCIIRTPQASAGRGAGGMSGHFESFALDTNGVAHTIAKGPDWGEVERPAKWLAESLDVPYEDETYG